MWDRESVCPGMEKGMGGWVRTLGGRGLLAQKKTCRVEGRSRRQQRCTQEEQSKKKISKLFSVRLKKKYGLIRGQKPCANLQKEGSVS